jgi:hypothetical protein
MAYNISSNTAESVLKDSYMININQQPGLTLQSQYQYQNYYQQINPTNQVLELENQYINTNKPTVYVPVPGSTKDVSYPSENITNERTQFEKELIEVLVNFKIKIDNFDQFKNNVENQIVIINDRLNKLTDLVMNIQSDLITINTNLIKEEIKEIKEIKEVKTKKSDTNPSEELIEEVYILLSDETKPMLLNTIRSKLPKKVLPPAGLRGIFKQLIDNIPGIKKVIEKRVDSIGEIRDEYLYYIYDNENKIEGFNKICKSGKPCKLDKKGVCSICK